MEKIIKTSQGDITVRGLKHREIKAIRNSGYDLANIPKEKSEEFVDAVLGLIFPDALFLEELYEHEYLNLINEVMKLTYPSEEQIKNSDSQ